MVRIGVGIILPGSRLVHKWLIPHSAKRYRNRTWFVSEVLIVLGLLFLFLFLEEYIFHWLSFDKHGGEVLLAFAILFLGIGFFVLFLAWQFSKLAHIAEEVENETFDGVEPL